MRNMSLQDNEGRPKNFYLSTVIDAEHQTRKYNSRDTQPKKQAMQYHVDSWSIKVFSCLIQDTKSTAPEATWQKLCAICIWAKS